MSNLFQQTITVVSLKQTVHLCLFTLICLVWILALRIFEQQSRHLNDNDRPFRGFVVVTSTQPIESLKSYFEKRRNWVKLPGKTVPQNDVCTHAAHRFVIARDFPMGVANKPVRRNGNQDMTLPESLPARLLFLRKFLPLWNRVQRVCVPCVCTCKNFESTNGNVVLIFH